MHDKLQLLAGLVGVVAYLLLIRGILKATIEQSFAAFMLWGMLDLIATITTILDHGNFWLPLSNALGSTVIAVLLATKQKIKWTWVETMTSCLVVACLVIWYFSGETMAIIASSIAVVIASIPQMADTWKKPANTPVLTYCVFLVANIISFAAGKSWTIEERFYSACAIFLCVVIISFTFRKK